MALAPQRVENPSVHRYTASSHVDADEEAVGIGRLEQRGACFDRGGFVDVESECVSLSEMFALDAESTIAPMICR